MKFYEHKTWGRMQYAWLYFDVLELGLLTTQCLIVVREDLGLKNIAHLSCGTNSLESRSGQPRLEKLRGEHIYNISQKVSSKYNTVEELNRCNRNHSTNYIGLDLLLYHCVSLGTRPNKYSAVFKTKIELVKFFLDAHNYHHCTV